MSKQNLIYKNDRAINGFNSVNPPEGVAIRLDVNSWSNTSKTPWSDPSNSLVDKVMRELWISDNPSRFVLVYNAVPTLIKEAGMDLNQAVELTRLFRRNLCDRIYAQFTESFPAVINPEGIALEPMEAYIDGFNRNPSPMNRYSTKQLHFDIIEPIGSNLYGPNRNVAGGFPVFADALAYCRANGFDITDILEKIPGERTLTLKPPHYAAVVSEFSVAYDVDMVNDTPFSIILNRVIEAGVMHGATLCKKIETNEEGHRPLLHYEYINTTQQAADSWYESLGLSNSSAPGQSGLKHLIPSNMQPQVSPLVIQLA